jgi:hypothetical protein
LLNGETGVDCPACKRLREELSQATKAHFSILSKIQLARTEHDSELLKDLESLKAAAAARRDKARIA